MVFHKYLNPHFERELLQKMDDPKLSRKEHNKAVALHSLGNIPIGAAVGSTAGVAFGGKGHRKKYAGIGALAGGVYGTAAALGEATGSTIRYEARRSHPDSKYVKMADRQTDILRVADGKMSKSEFNKKWNKE